MSKELYTLTIHSSKVASDPNSGTRLAGKYRVLWNQILPTKYRRFTVSAYFRTNQSSTAGVLASTATICVHTNLIASSSYQVLNHGRSTLMCVSEKNILYSGVTYTSYNLCRDCDSHSFIIDYPVESYLNVTLFDIDGSTAITGTDLDKDFVLILTFEPVD